MRNIILTGPESSGKTTLSKELSERLGIPYHAEYAREFLNQLNRHYTLEDVIAMAKKQLELHQQTEPNTSHIFDTDLLVYKVWLQEKYDRSYDWIDTAIANSQNNIYLLCDIDITWTPDPLREHPNPEDRKRLFQTYFNFLESNSFTFKVVSGDKNQRLKNAVNFIKQQK